VCGLGFPLGARIDAKRQLMAPTGDLKDESGPILSWGIDPSDLPQTPDDDWPGFSGAAVLLAETNDEGVIWLYGVVQDVPPRFNRKLDVARLETALQDPDFCQALRKADLSPDPAVDPTEGKGQFQAKDVSSFVLARYKTLSGDQLNRVPGIGDSSVRTLDDAYVPVTLVERRWSSASSVWSGLVDSEARSRRNIFPEFEGDDDPGQSIGPKASARFTPEELLRPHMRVERTVIVGPPGCGKTMLLRYLGWKTFQHENRIPIYLELKSVSENSFIQSGEGAEKLANLLFDKVVAGQRLTTSDRDSAKADFLERLAGGHFVILLDGLDEVSGSSFFDDLCMVVNQFAQSAYGTNQVVLSTRPYALKARFEQFKVFEIAPFRHRQVAAFLAKYSGRERAQRQLLADFRIRPEIRELGSIPYLLGMLVDHYRARGQFDNGILALLRQIVHGLSGKIDREKSVRRTLLMSDPEGSLKREFLEHMAYSRLFGTTESDQLSFVFTDEEIIEEAKRFRRVERLSQLDPYLLAADVKATPLLRELGADTYAFAHLLMHEYLAAVALAKKKDCKSIFFHAYFNPTMAESEVLPMTLGLVRHAAPLYADLEQLSESLTFTNLRLRIRSLGYAAKIGTEHLATIAEQLNGLVREVSPYLRGVLRSFFGTIARSADYIAETLIPMLLGEGNDELRRTTAYALGSIGGERAMEALLEALAKDEDDGVRRRAVTWLALIGDERAVPALLKAISDNGESGFTGQSAANAVGEIGGAQALKGLFCAAMNPDSEIIRCRALSGLGVIGGERALGVIADALSKGGNEAQWAANSLDNFSDEQLVPLCLQAFNHCDENVVQSAADRLGNIGGEPVATAMLSILGDKTKSGSARLHAAYTLGIVGDSTVVPALLIALRGDDEDPVVRGLAANALGRLAAHDAAPDLIRELKARDSFLRRKAAEALGDLQTRDAVPFLLAAMNDGEMFVVDAAAASLGKIGGEPVVKQLMDLVKCKAGYASAAAIDALEKMGEERAIPTLIAALQDDDDFTRNRAAEALGRFIVAGKTGNGLAIKAMESLLGRNDAMAMHAAYALGPKSGERGRALGLTALRSDHIASSGFGSAILGRMADASVVPELIETIQDNRFSVRWNAAKALWRIPRDVLVNGLLQCLTHPESNVRLTSMEVAGYYKQDEGLLRELSRLASEDPEESVKATAEAVLRKLQYARRLLDNSN
jgi:HEAT repeat protein